MSKVIRDYFPCGTLARVFAFPFQMLACRSCFIDCLRAIVGESAPAVRGSTSSLVRSTGRRRRNRSPARTYATALTKPIDYAFQREKREEDRGPFKPFDKTSQKPLGSDLTAKVREQLDQKVTPKQEKELSIELKWLRDPLKLAGHVRQTLRSNDLEKALALCRMASREGQYIVSWNHVIDWLMSRRDVKSAFKIYNEVRRTDSVG